VGIGVLEGEVFQVARQLAQLERGSVDLVEQVV
jgi:hypothetical protein